MRIKRIIQTITFCTIFVLLFQHIYKILSWKDTAGDYYSSMDSLYELEDDLVDVLFLGSSHCYCSVNNSILWDEHGISSFSLAISGQDLASTYHCLVEALKTQSPEVVCVELYGAAFDGYQYEGNLYRNTLPYKFSENAYNAVNSMVEDGREAEFLLKWPIVHTRYAELQEEDFAQERQAYLGYYAEFETQTIADITPYQGTEVTPLSETGEKWLRKIIELGKETGTQLCFFVAPYAAPVGEQMFYRYVQGIAEENSIPYIDMIAMADELGLNEQSDFIDWMHTNFYGSEKVSRYLGQYLTENYELENHKGDERYRLWEEDLKVRQHELQKQQLKLTNDIGSYLDMISYIKDYTVIVATSGDFYYSGLVLTDHLQTVGIGEEFYESNHIWIFENGQLVQSFGEPEVFYHEKLGRDDLTVSSSQGAQSIIIDKQNHIKVTDGINIVVYDNVLGQVADAIGFWSIYEYGGAR